MDDPAAQAALDRFTPPDATQMQHAVAFIANYAAAWAKPRVSAEDLRERIHPDTQMLIPPMTSPADREGVITHFAGVLERVPDLHLEVIRWAATGDVVFIEWRATASIAGQPLAWQGVDRFNLKDGLQIGGQAYWDTRQLDANFASAVQAAQAAAAATKDRQ